MSGVVEHSVAMVTILSTPDDPESGAAKWSVVKPQEVPDFVKGADILGELLADPTLCVQDRDVSELSFRAVRVTDPRVSGNQLGQKPRIILPH